MRAFGSIWNVSAISPVSRIGGGHRDHLRESKPRLAQPVAQSLLGRGDEPLRIQVALPHDDELAQDLLRHHEAARELDRAHLPGRALVHIQRDEEIVLLGRQRDLRGGELEIGIAAIHVIGAELLHVALEHLA